MNSRSGIDMNVQQQDGILSLESAVERLRELADEYFTSQRSGDEAYHQIRLLIPPLDPLDWLGLQTLKPAVYWGARDKEFRIAGIGAAARFTSAAPINIRQVVEGLTKNLAADPELRIFGGFRFDTSVYFSTDWEIFGSYYFFIPRITIEQTGKQHTLTLTLHRHDQAEPVHHDLDKLQGMSTGRYTEPIEAMHVTDTPDRRMWDTQVANALDEFKRKALHKVVLSRHQRIECRLGVRPTPLLAQLADSSGDGTSFLISPDADIYFVGHSPERLYRRHGRTILTEAVAGTRPRGSSETEDLRLAEELMSSDKELREHQAVSIHINEALQRLCTQVTIPKSPQIMKLARLQHMVTPFSGTLKPKVGDGEILAALHPTPAVAGYPTAYALPFIAEHEAHDRGWYAGPVGWIGRDASEFVVAIRSALLRGHVAHLFAGNGIVAGSDPSAEWEETEQKLGGLRKFFFK